MNILIIGCGKVGSMLATQLNRMGHDVSVLDQIESHFDQLESDFSGYTITGVPIDQDVLRRAGIESCDAVLSMLEDDNANIMICQMAKEVFHVDIVLARVFDPSRGEIFKQFNIQTISPTNLTVDVVVGALSGPITTQHTTIGDTTLSYRILQPQKEWIGRYVKDLVIPNTHLLGTIGKNGFFTLAHTGQEMIAPGDQLVAVHVAD